jgi:hypothetical protein
LEKFGLVHRVIAFVKDENINLAMMVTFIQFIINYEPLKILKVYEGTCFGHVMYKAY